MTERQTDSDFEIVSKIVSFLQDLEKEKRIHILKTVNTWFRVGRDTTLDEASLPEKSAASQLPKTTRNELPTFSDRDVMTPKDFLIEKNPRTEVERVTCLSYYLTHYRETPHFKTVEISEVNMEAAQPKFRNASQAVKNATNVGLLATVSRGKKQLSAIGEQFVLALPDREEAKALLERRIKRRSKKAPRKRRSYKKGSQES